MADIDPLVVDQSPEARAKRFAFAVRAHEIEGNPLDPEDLALFERFEREGLSDEQARAALIAEAWKLAAR